MYLYKKYESVVVSGQESDDPSRKQGRDGRNRGVNVDRDTTTKCAPGTRSKTGYEPKCRPCNTGHFNPTGGTAPCKRCPKGHFNPEQGAVSNDTGVSIMIRLHKDICINKFKDAWLPYLQCLMCVNME